MNKQNARAWLAPLMGVGLAFLLLGCNKKPADDQAQEAPAFNLYSLSVRLLTTAEFQSEVLDYRGMSNAQNEVAIKLTRPAVIDYYADWCAPCRDSSPMFDRLAVQFADHADFYRVNVDEEPELFAITGQDSIPLFLFLWPSGAATFRVGFGEHTEEEMIELIERYIIQGEALIPPTAGN